MVIILDESESESEMPKASSAQAPLRRKAIPKTITPGASSSLPNTPAPVKKSAGHPKNLTDLTAHIKTESESIFRSPGASTDSMSDLPEFARAEWLSSFLPTFYAYLGSCADPLDVCTGKGIIKEIQDIVDIVYPTSNYTVQYNSKFYSVVSSNLRSDFLH